MIISQAKEPEADRNLIKIIFFGILSIASSFLTIYCFNRFLSTNSYPFLFWSFLFSWFFVVLIILEVLFIKSVFKLNLIILLASLATLFGFYSKIFVNTSSLLLIAAAIFFIFLIMAANRGFKLRTNLIKIDFFLFARAVIPKTITAILIFWCFLIYLNFFQWGKFNEKMGQDLIDRSLFISKPILGFFIPSFAFNESVGDFLRGISEKQFEKIRTDLVNESVRTFNFDLKNLSPETKEQILTQSVKELELYLEKYIGPIEQSDPMNMAIFKIIKNYIINLPGNIKPFFGFLTALSVFLILKGIAILFYWFIEITAWIIYKFLLVAGFGYVMLETRTREVLLLK